MWFYGSHDEFDIRRASRNRIVCRRSISKLADAGLLRVRRIIARRARPGVAYKTQGNTGLRKCIIGVIMGRKLLGFLRSRQKIPSSSPA